MTKKPIIISSILIIAAIIFTIAVKFFDVQNTYANPLVGSGEPVQTSIGFANINLATFNALGTNETWYKITEYFGISLLAIIILSYVAIGAYQLIKQKSFKKVQKEIYALAIFYAIVAAVYVLFEKLALNYRPVLIDGELEASYPSSHTLLTICICFSAIIINRQLFKNRFTKVVNVLLVLSTIIIVVGRLLSGVHWLSDIIGGIIISAALLSVFYIATKSIAKK